MSVIARREAVALAGANRGSGWPRSLLDLLVRWQDRARQRRALAALDDRLLRDIGMTRAMLDAERSKPFWRE